ncbi:uncharacterized protein F5891DRAFT_986597 [Suillus fuscotomentosus]|uniref:Uncharacterized protein n=1 Tax=Suillus fuscotomentosus TaxID=1912939 RepID=A0AAD4DT10_9AGAM|nr:uncharacterized protein F5891DRAFT_986597 [Suillus fuscotomentosus]KAG1891724.1 hypothetical protein F5891DRAFT_986597 [Suillus fuscotomentosus]
MHVQQELRTGTEKVWREFFERWPERSIILVQVPADQGLTEEQESLLKAAVIKRRKLQLSNMGRWATKEQIEFLERFLPEYCECMFNKNYKPVLKKVWREFFEHWPEHSIILAQVPADQGLTEEQESLLKAAQITSWYRWQTNVSCLSRTSGAKGLLKFDAVLAGGVGLSGTRAPKKMHIYSHEYYAEKVRIDADQAIHENNIAHHGAKLNKRLAVTQEKFEAESDKVKEEVERKYRKAKAKFAKARERLKGGKMPKIDTNVKVKAIRELGPMLDRIFRYLSYATGSWKFSVLMAGPDPTKGGTAVYDYHIGELGNGAQFNTFCEKFDSIQQAFLEFTDRALEFKATLPQNDSDSDLESDDNSDNEMNNIQTNSMEGRAEAGSMNLNFHTDNSLYRISPDLFNNESQEHSALFDNAGQGFLLHEHQQQSTLPDQAFQYLDLNFGQTDLDPSVQALIAGSDTQVQVPSLGPFIPGSSIVLNSDMEIQTHPLDSFTPSSTFTELPLFTPSSAISKLPLVLPPPPTPPQTPQICLPAVPVEPIHKDLDVPVPSSPPNHRRRARAPAVQQQVLQEEPRQHHARNVTFNRRELDNAIGSNASAKQK